MIMPYIKKMVMHGFKSFANKTEIPFDKGMNVVVGPNGSGKSNIADALCFVLGRLSIKSMRAAKAANLIFSGTKEKKPAGEAAVDLVFDNSDKGFHGMGSEVHLRRIVRRNGQSIYKINDEAKTRQEIIELLATAGIDPNGYNIVLQGQISAFVKMHSEDRRRIIEEVAGISVYEMRKEKALHELEKTDERLKEVSTILRERTAYLRNLEEERKQALRFQELETLVKRCKASIFARDMAEKDKEISSILQEIDKVAKEIENIKKNSASTNQEVQTIEEKIKGISQIIQHSGGKEQEVLNSEISSLRESIAVLDARKDNYSNQIEELKRRALELSKNIRQAEEEIEQAKKGKKEFLGGDLKKKKQELEEVEERRKKFYTLKTELSALSERAFDKRRDFQKVKNDAEFTLNQISQFSSGLSILELKKAQSVYKELKQDIDLQASLEKKIQEELLILEKNSAIAKSRIDNLRKVEENVSKLDICPVCKTKITKEHSCKVIEETSQEINKYKSDLEGFEQKKKNNEEKIAEIRGIIRKKTESKDKLMFDINKLENIEDKKNYLAKLSDSESSLKQELDEAEKKKKLIERGIEEYRNIEERYDRLYLEVNELMRREEANIGLELTSKERENDRMRIIIKQNEREILDFENKIREVEKELDEKSSLLYSREKQEREQYDKYQRLFKERQDLQEKIKEKEKKGFDLQGDARILEEKVNNFKINLARVNAEKEALSIDSQEYQKEEIIEGSRNFLLEKLEKTKATLASIGSVNMRALEVYDEIKKEYDSVAEKASILNKEKEEIMKIIEEIDIKKKKTFMKTLHAINELFMRNVSELYSKGTAFLEVENHEDIFAGGVSIVIKIGHGKYFDSSSLSGGEQTLIALSLIFAIQEYKPYAFYIFDEIDAALDKRNSERLAVLIKRYMNIGQYIIVTHNDAIITESTTLYGVSMHEGVSKVLSLPV